MRVIGLAALILMASAIGCGETERAAPPTVAPTPSLAGWTCEELLLEILEINEKAVAEDSREDKVLNVYDVEEANRSEDRLDCAGLARTTQGSDNKRFDFHRTRDRDGNQVLGYQLAPVATPTPSATHTLSPTPINTPTTVLTPTRVPTNTPVPTATPHTHANTVLHTDAYTDGSPYHHANTVLHTDAYTDGSPYHHAISVLDTNAHTDASAPTHRSRGIWYMGQG